MCSFDVTALDGSTEVTMLAANKSSKVVLRKLETSRGASRLTVRGTRLIIYSSRRVRRNLSLLEVRQSLHFFRISFKMLQRYECQLAHLLCELINHLTRVAKYWRRKKAYVDSRIAKSCCRSDHQNYRAVHRCRLF